MSAHICQEKSAPHTLPFEGYSTSLELTRINLLPKTFHWWSMP